MKFRRPRSLNGLILVGFGLVGLPLLIAVIWALVNLDRLAEQSERLVFTGVAAAENNRLLEETRRLARTSGSSVPGLWAIPIALELLRQDLATIEAQLAADDRAHRASRNVTALAASIGAGARRIVNTLERADLSDDDETAVQSKNLRFAAATRNRVNRDADLSTSIPNSRACRKARASRATRLGVAGCSTGTGNDDSWCCSFILCWSRVPFGRLITAISQLGQSGFSKPIDVKGPTDLERLGKQLEWLRLRLLELAQEKNKFLRHMSHELKTPLANIREGTELLLDGTVGELDQPQREVTDILRMNGLKLQQLIENLLSFSAWQTKTEVLTLTDFPIRALAISVAKAQRLALKAAHIQLKLEIEDIIVNADRDKIRTVLDNLLSNAVKFTPKGGYITIPRTRHRRVLCSNSVIQARAFRTKKARESSRPFSRGAQNKVVRLVERASVYRSCSSVSRPMRARWNWSIRMSFRVRIFGSIFRRSAWRRSKSWQRMHKGKLTTRVRQIAVTTLSVALLAGCAQTKDFITGMGKSPSSSGDVGILGAPEAEHYLDELYKLAAGDPATQAEIFADAQSGAQLTPGPQTNLRNSRWYSRRPATVEFDPERKHSRCCARY